MVNIRTKQLLGPIPTNKQTTIIINGQLSLVDEVTFDGCTFFFFIELGGHERLVKSSLYIYFLLHYQNSRIYFRDYSSINDNTIKLCIQLYLNDSS